MNPGVGMRAILLGLAATAASACGTDPTALNSAAPSLFAVPILQVAGQWKGTSILLNSAPVTGILGSSAECVGADIDARLRLASLSQPVAMTMSQDGADVSGRLTTASAVACSYKGKAGHDSFRMDSASCEALPVLVSCSIGGARELDLVGSSVSGGVLLGASLGTITGTVTDTYNIFTTTTPKQGVGSLILNYSYSVNRNQQ